jgi:hypothetical protein
MRLAARLFLGLGIIALPAAVLMILLPLVHEARSRARSSRSSASIWRLAANSFALSLLQPRYRFRRHERNPGLGTL